MRAGLKPTFRKIWAPIGERPIAVGHPRYPWCYWYGFVHPTSGETVWFSSNTVSIAGMNEILKAFAEEVEANAQNQHIILWDGAGWHNAKKMVLPEGIHVIQQPPYSPELQPSERLWPLVKEAIANIYFKTLDELKDRIEERCMKLSEQPKKIAEITHYSWWPKDRIPPPVK